MKSVDDNLDKISIQNDLELLNKNTAELLESKWCIRGGYILSFMFLIIIVTMLAYWNLVLKQVDIEYKKMD